MTVTLLNLIEDVPQLVLQSIYFDTVEKANEEGGGDGGFGDADAIALLAFVCSCTSLGVNVITAVLEFANMYRTGRTGWCVPGESHHPASAWALRWIDGLAEKLGFIRSQTSV